MSYHNTKDNLYRCEKKLSSPFLSWFASLFASKKGFGYQILVIMHPAFLLLEIYTKTNCIFRLVASHTWIGTNCFHTTHIHILTTPPQKQNWEIFLRTSIYLKTISAVPGCNGKSFFFRSFITSTNSLVSLWSLAYSWSKLKLTYRL